ncbi:MAG TPA: helix-turn-helix domain-containing protein [Spirochaetales bacterium]|nr:helix-turn-helix domain-containing protein [Spirochaetales bacterium]
MLPDDLKQELLESLPAILDVPDICSILRVSRKTVLREISAHRLIAYQVDDEWNVNRTDFLAYLSRNGTL